MAEMKLEAEKRTVFGKQVKTLRQKGLAPCNVYGGDQEPTPVQVDARALQQLIKHGALHSVISLSLAGQKNPQTVLLRDLQQEPKTGTILSAEFQRLRTNEPITVAIPIVITGEPQLVDEKPATLLRDLTTLEVRGLPDKLPNNIMVDVSGLKEVGQAIHVSDVSVPKGITVLTAKDSVIARVAPIQAPAAPTPLTAEEAEVEVIRASTETPDTAAKASEEE